MRYFKFVALLTALVLVSAVSWAGNTPEYDAVGTDSANIYSVLQGATYGAVNLGPNAALEADSNFVRENFDTNAGQAKLSPCFLSVPADPPIAVPVHLTDVWNEGTYEWDIVLQMKPESDINLNIYDCVLKHNETNIYVYADQTGRYRQPWGELVFNPLYSPLISATASPGPYATTGFQNQFLADGPLILDARLLPTLVKVPMVGVSYTSKAHWPEGIVLAMPKTGEINESGQDEWNLKQGDLISVIVSIPDMTNTVDVWYGAQSVLLKYIGIINTEYFASLPN